jgi:hypothetical protein
LQLIRRRSAETKSKKLFQRGVGLKQIKALRDHANIDSKWYRRREMDA